MVDSPKQDALTDDNVHSITTSLREDTSCTPTEKIDALQKHPLDSSNNISDFPNKRARVDPIQQYNANNNGNDADISLVSESTPATEPNQVQINQTIPKNDDGRSNNRLRYNIEQLRSMKHDSRMVSLNDFAFSKHAVEQVFDVSATQDMVQASNGQLRTSDVLVDIANSQSVPTFAEMQLPASIVKGLNSAGFTQPSPVQLRGIPVARLGIDVIAQAKSGTGKTLVFLTTVVELALSAAQGCVCAVVLVPTREIARQVGKVVKDVLDGARDKKVSGEKTEGKSSSTNSNSDSKKESTSVDVAILVGGHPEHLDVSRLKNATVVVGTPARVRGLITKGIFDPKAVQLLVLDEADKLLDGGAGFNLSEVVLLLPSRRQSMAFSATYTPALVASLQDLMRKPRLVWLGEQGIDNEMKMSQSAVLRGVGQWRVDVENDKDKLRELIRVLQNQTFNAAIVFVNQRDKAKEVSKMIKKSGKTCRYVTAALTNSQRRDAMGLFSKGKVKVLVCTDMLSRGVSFDVCDLVIHMAVPRKVNTYLHRVGRAGRFGCEGTSVILVSKAQRNDVNAIETHIGKIKVWTESEARNSQGGKKESKKVVSDIREEEKHDDDESDIVDAVVPTQETYENAVDTSEEIVAEIKNEQAEESVRKLDVLCTTDSNRVIADEKEKTNMFVAKAKKQTKKRRREIAEESEKLENETEADFAEDCEAEENVGGGEFSKGFSDGYAAAQEMIARIESYRQSPFYANQRSIDA